MHQLSAASALCCADCSLSSLFGDTSHVPSGLHSAPEYNLGCRKACLSVCEAEAEAGDG